MPIYFTGASTPGGATTQLQFNNAGVFGGISGATTDGINVTLTGPLTFTQGTITVDAPQINGTVTWNNSGIVGPAWKLNVTATSANVAALLEDLQVGGTSAWKVDRTGLVTQTGGLNLPAGTLATGGLSITLGGDTGTGWYRNAANQWTWVTGGSTAQLSLIGGNIRMQSTFVVSWTASNSTAAADLTLTRSAAATLQLGAADVNGSAVAQTLQVQSAITGTDQNGANWTFKGSKQTGAGTPGDIIFQTSVKLASSTTQGTPVTGLTITGAIASMQPSVLIGNQALATTATEGFLYIPTCAGTPTGVPTTRTGRIAMIYDTTNHQFWFYDGAWLQPKTPAGAAIVSWQ